jgi:hypothetical protein
MEAAANGWGLAQQTARAKGLQARILWIDATANIDRINTEAEVIQLVSKIVQAGFNTIVFDVKPISGQVMYKSKFAPKITEWRGRQLPLEFDPLQVMANAANSQGIRLLVSLNAFSEGHRDFKVGPGYQKPEWQSVLYEPALIVRSTTGVGCEIHPAINQPSPSQSLLAGYDDSTKVPSPVAGMSMAAVDRNGIITEYLEFNTSIGARAIVPRGGSVLVGLGDSARFLRDYVQAGTRVSFDTETRYVPISQRPEQQIPLMTNPNSPAVQDYALNIVRELLVGYPIGGIIYDDRLRYGGINADFSPSSQFAFEQFVGRSVRWPDDVYKFTLQPNLTRGIIPGRYYDAWMTWRALTLRNFVGRVRDLVKAQKPKALFGTYVGSWFGEYQRFGNNWTSPDAESGFWFHTEDYQKTGYAPLVDFMITGCYYPTATIFESMGLGQNIGLNVESAGQLSNRLVRDMTWTYAGIMLSDFKNNPDGLKNALQAATGSTQGVMVFDLSHDIEPMWPVFAQAFQQRKMAPHDAEGVLADVRRRRQSIDKLGQKDRPIPINGGAPGTGL